MLSANLYVLCLCCSSTAQDKACDVSLESFLHTLEIERENESDIESETTSDGSETTGERTMMHSKIDLLLNSLKPCENIQKIIPNNPSEFKFRGNQDVLTSPSKRQRKEQKENDDGIFCDFDLDKCLSEDYSI